MHRSDYSLKLGYMNYKRMVDEPLNEFKEFDYDSHSKKDSTKINLIQVHSGFDLDILDQENK